MAENVKRKRPGPKPMTATQKKASAKRIAREKKQAENMVPAVILQYAGDDVDVGQLVERAKEDFRSVKKRTRILDLKLYVKPEESAVYYVVNGEYEGKINF